MTDNIFDIISTREAALIFYLFVGVGIGLLVKDIRNSLTNLLRILFGKKIGTILGFQVIYVTLTVFVLSKMGLWNQTFLKDTLFWFFTSALVTLFSINKAENSHFFIDLCKENLKWAVFIDFLVQWFGTFLRRSESEFAGLTIKPSYFS